MYVVATPIGNLGDFSPRAVETLKGCDLIACEDTRPSSSLLRKFGISAPFVVYEDSREKIVAPAILQKLKEGKNVGLISDAGTPCISDPGSVLVNALKENGIPYTVISGASAFVNAFVLSGYKPPFTFYGFLPQKQGDRDALLDGCNGVAIFYVAVHDLQENMNYLCGRLGDRSCCLVRELTKAHEEVIFTTLSQKIERDKGEFVLVVDRQQQQNPLCSLTVRQHVDYYVSGGMPKNLAVKQVAKDRNLPKNEIYRQTLD